MDTGIQSGLIITVIGLVIFALIWTLTRWALRSQSAWQAAIKNPLEMPEHEDAVLLIHAGGRVDHINTAARELFRLSENEIPNLERLARLAHPNGAFGIYVSTRGRGVCQSGEN